jgi:hypothetical protein
MSVQCRPGNQGSEATCLPSASIRKLVKTWNKTHKNKIRVGGARTAKNKGKKNKTQALWSALRDAMAKKYSCDNEYCAVKKLAPTKDAKQMLTFFKPERPTAWDKDPKQWLDTENIELVMKQYEAAHPHFAFLGAVPLDFDTTVPEWGQCVSEEMCKLNLEQSLKKGKTDLGVIFNLDPHDKPGSHWVCAYVNIPKKSAYYYDSYGYEPEEEIAAFLERVQQQGCENVYYNDIRHQRSESECGTYCMYVVLNLLGGRGFQEICKDVVSDEVMNTFRDVLFAEERPRKEAIEKALPMLQKLRLV